MILSLSLISFIQLAFRVELQLKSWLISKKSGNPITKSNPLKIIFFCRTFEETRDNQKLAFKKAARQSLGPWAYHVF